MTSCKLSSLPSHHEYWTWSQEIPVLVSVLLQSFSKIRRQDNQWPGLESSIVSLEGLAGMIPFSSEGQWFFTGGNRENSRRFFWRTATFYGFHVWTFFLCGVISPQALFKSDMVRCVSWVSHWSESLRVCLWVCGRCAGWFSLQVCPWVKTKPNEARGPCQR